MKKLIQIYKPLSIIEITLLCSVLIHVAIVIARRSSQYIDLIVLFILFLIPIAISWKIISLTTKGSKANETLVIVGHIFNIIKLLGLFALIIGGLYFLIETNSFMTFENEKGIWYYLFFFSFFIFLVVSLLIFISYFAISKDNKEKINNLTETIGNLGS